MALKDPRAERGRTGERLARSFLEEAGYDILGANCRNRYGEIDIIARTGDIVVFVEVKARRSRRHGEPFEAVSPRKQQQIHRMAEMWVAAHARDDSLRHCAFRFDVISIMLGEDADHHLTHMPDAFR